MPEADQMSSLVMAQALQQANDYKRVIGAALARAANQANPHPELGNITYESDGLHVPLAAHIASEGASRKRIDHAMHKTNNQGRAILQRIRQTPRYKGNGFLRKALTDVVKRLPTLLR